MGKKSRKSGTAAAWARSGASGGIASGATSGTEGAGRSGGIGKKARCVSCLALIRDTAKGHVCPGCSELYCWRCEKKNFMRCPNLQNCVLPQDRCKHCASARIMDKELLVVGEKRSGHVIKPWHREIFKVIIKERDDLTLEAMPFFKCGSGDCSGNALSAIECSRCVEGPSLKKLFFCSSCEKVRCRPCAEAAGAPSSGAMAELYRDVVMGGKDAPCSALIEGFGDKLSAIPDAMARCYNCHKTICYECLNGVEIKHLAKIAVAAGMRARGRFVEDGKASFQCSHCYWASKPCTNPTCPNEIGIPTKRCGGCHLDRYCSVKCQAAAYRYHVSKCEKIQAKRAAAKKEGEEE